MKRMGEVIVGSLWVVALIGWASLAQAGVTPAAKCEALKNQQAGKYALCLQTAEMKLVKTKGACSATTSKVCYLDTDCPSGEKCMKDLTKYNASVTTCQETLAAKWAKWETNAGGSCPTTGDEAGMQSTVADVASCLAGNLAGGPATCDPATLQASLNSCNGSLTAYEGYYSTCETSLSTQTTETNTCETNLSACYTDCTNSSLDACEGNLATCQAQGSAQPPAQVLQTGQTMCWDGNGYVIACAGTGQDGALQKGSALAYTDNGDGTITDTKTGLMWEKKVAYDGTLDATNLHDADNCYPWSGTCGPGGVACGTDADCGANGPCQAADCQTASPNGLTIFKWVAALNAANFAEYNDWRVPNVRELQSIVDYNGNNPAVAPAFNGVSCGSTCTDVTSAACSCTNNHYYYYYYYGYGYWSSTTYQLSPNDAWLVSFYDGYAWAYYKSSTNGYVRAVRGGS